MASEIDIPQSQIPFHVTKQGLAWHPSAIPSQGDGVLNPLFKLAVISGAAPAIQFYIHRGENINARDSEGRSPIVLATLKGNVDTCKLLLEAGADPLLTDNHGTHALSIAKIKGFHEIAALIQDYLKSPEKPDPQPEITTGDEIDISQWEEEPRSAIPPNDEAVKMKAGIIQSEIGRHDPIDTATDWSEVDILIPFIPSGRLWSSIDVAGLKRLISEGIREGYISETEIQRTLSPSDDHDGDFEERVRLTFSDLGVLLSDYSHGQSEMINDEEEDTLEQDLLADSLSFLEDLSSSRGDPLKGPPLANWFCFKFFYDRPKN